MRLRYRSVRGSERLARWSHMKGRSRFSSEAPCLHKWVFRTTNWLAEEKLPADHNGTERQECLIRRSFPIPH